MSAKDQAIGKLLSLLRECDTDSVVRLATQVEDSLEVGPWGICRLTENHEPRMEAVPAGLKEAYEV